MDIDRGIVYMKKMSSRHKQKVIVSICIYCILCFSCASARKNVTILESTEPVWISDKGRLELFPSHLYVSQFGYGNTAQESKEKAAASISEYIKTHVTYSSSSLYFYREAENVFASEKELKSSIKVSTDNTLYKIEYTKPYFYSNLGQYVCVAYINREQAFNFVKPKLEIAKKQFPMTYYDALEKPSLLDKIIGIKKAQLILHDFYEVYDFARAILIEEAKAYEPVDYLASESIMQIKDLVNSVIIQIEGAGDLSLLAKSGVIAELSEQFKKLGFVIGNSYNSNCIALVEVNYDIRKTQETFEAYPELFIRIIEKGNEKISYAKKLSKVAGFDRETVERRTNLALANEIKTSFTEECFE